MGIYRGVKLVLWQKMRLRGTTCQAGRPARVAERQVSWTHRLWALNAPCTDLSRHVGKAEFEKAPTPSRLAKEVGSVGPTLARLGPSFVSHHPLMSYSL
jgi:hypothetical protein